MKYPEDFDNLFIESYAEFSALSKPEQIAYCIHQLEAEVNNGGFHQFFGNSSGAFTLETVSALGEICAIKTKAILEDAIAISYPNGFPADPMLHDDSILDIDVIENLLNVQDDLFYKYEEPLDNLVNEYLTRHTYS